MLQSAGPAYMIYKSILRPILFQLSPETAHELALGCLSISLKAKPLRNVIASSQKTSPFGKLNRFGLEFDNAVGLAAGFDKNGRAADALAALGFGFVEVGTVTGEPQPGNAKPRVFRLPRDRALINRLGFNNEGAKQVAENLRGQLPNCLLGVNIGKSRSVAIEAAIPDYLSSLEAVFDVADYIAVNVSSPNTPNLRDLQTPALLEQLLVALQKRNAELAERALLDAPKPLLLKIAPDLTEGDIESIVDIAMSNRIAGLIATNTTIRRDGLETPREEIESIGEGGLSGAPLGPRANQVIALIYKLSEGKLPIIGVGGVFNAHDAWEKICAGASLIQLYTGFIYEGPGVARRINEGLAQILKGEGFDNLDDAVGCRVK